ncbi:hypothetical protein BC826DRAFT_1167095 [Russula brevipes]|nr:hypothetical protein BC826DRAFT_1167095 [Russula brevipes]
MLRLGAPYTADPQLWQPLTRCGDSSAGKSQNSVPSRFDGWEVFPKPIRVLPPRTTDVSRVKRYRPGLSSWAFDHLVIVPGHGIWTGAYPENAEIEGSVATCFIPEGTPASVHFMRTHIPKVLELSSSSAGVPLANEADEREAAAGEVTPLRPLFRIISSLDFRSVVQRIYSVLWGPVRLSRTPREKKRAERNFHMRTHTWLSCWPVGAPEMDELLEWCPKDGKRDIRWDTSLGK